MLDTCNMHLTSHSFLWHRRDFKLCSSHFPWRRRDFKIAHGNTEGESDEEVMLGQLKDELARKTLGRGFFELDETGRRSVAKNA